MDPQDRSRHAIVERGKQIYAETLQANAERDHWGEFLVVDVHSGDFEIAKTHAVAARQLLKRKPQALLYGIRIGDVVAYRFGHRTIGDAK